MTKFWLDDEELDDLCREHGWDYAIKIEVASECAWSCEVRVTREPNKRGQADVSQVWFVTGAGGPSEAMGKAIAAAMAGLDALVEAR